MEERALKKSKIEENIFPLLDLPPEIVEQVCEQFQLSLRDIRELMNTNRQMNQACQRGLLRRYESYVDCLTQWLDNPFYYHVLESILSDQHVLSTDDISKPLLDSVTIKMARFLNEIDLYFETLLERYTDVQKMISVLERSDLLYRLLRNASSETTKDIHVLYWVHSSLVAKLKSMTGVYGKNYQLEEIGSKINDPIFAETVIVPVSLYIRMGYQNLLSFFFKQLPLRLLKRFVRSLMDDRGYPTHCDPEDFFRIYS